MHTLNISGERKLSKQRHNKNKVGVAIFKEFFFVEIPVQWMDTRQGYQLGVAILLNQCTTIFGDQGNEICN